MMTKKTILITMLLTLNSCSNSNAQVNLYCNLHRENNIKLNYNTYQNKIIDDNVFAKSSTDLIDTFYIPIVFHNLYTDNTDSITQYEINQILNNLNIDFNKNTYELDGTENINNLKIKYIIANKNPNGDNTNGVNYKRINGEIELDNLKIENRGGIKAWPFQSYLNIWVANLGGNLLGSATFPDNINSNDGIILNSSIFKKYNNNDYKYSLGKVATHEIGHWLGLLHIWGDDENYLDKCIGTDYVYDTPNQDLPNLICDESNPICDTIELINNYMDYTEDKCKDSFTPGQIERMKKYLYNNRMYLRYSNAYENKDLNIFEIKIGYNILENQLYIYNIPRCCLRFEITNMTGQMIYTEEIKNNVIELGQGIDYGIYILKIFNHTEILYNNKFLKY